MKNSGFITTAIYSAMLLCSNCVYADDASTEGKVDAAPVTATPPVENAPAAAAPAAAAPAPVAIPASSVWEVLPEKSSIEWVANYAGRTINGSFKEFTADVTFDPAHLETSHVTVAIDTAKISSDDKDAEGALPGTEWFDSAKTPKAVFEAKTFRHLEDEKYEADGTLTLGDKSMPLTLPFTVHFYDDNETTPAARYAQVTAETTIKRTLLGVGKGDWSKTDTVSDDVKVTISVKAKSSMPVTP